MYLRLRLEMLTFKTRLPKSCPFKIDSKIFYQETNVNKNQLTINKISTNPNISKLKFKCREFKITCQLDQAHLHQLDHHKSMFMKHLKV